MGWPADIERAKFYTNVVFPKKLESEMFASCCYCGRKIPRAEAVFREDVVMCPKCAEERSSTANDKMEQQK